MILTKSGFNKKNNFIKIAFMLFLVFHVSYMAIWGTQKINYHVDEYYTYGLANNRGSIEPVLEDGKIYKGDTVFLNYLARMRMNGLIIPLCGRIRQMMCIRRYTTFLYTPSVLFSRMCSANGKL